MIRGAALIAVGLALTGCGSDPAPEPSADTPAVDRVMLDRTGALLTDAGQTVAVQATPVGPDAEPVEADVTWTSSAPELVSVTDGVIRAEAPVGSAIVTATAGDRWSSVTVLVGQPVPGAVLIADDQVRSEPAPVDPNELPGVGSRWRVVLDPELDLDPGTPIIASGSAAIAGEVLTADAAADGLEVEFVVRRLDELFTAYAVNLELPLDVSTIAPSNDTEVVARGARTAGLRWTDDGIRLASIGPDRPTAFTKGPLSCTATGGGKWSPSAFDIRFQGTPVLQHIDQPATEAGGVSTPDHYRVAIAGPLVVRVTGGLKVLAGYTGTAECKLVWAMPIPFGGPVLAILRLEVPLGIGLSGEGKVTAVDIELGPQGTITTDVTLGFECRGNDCHVLGEQKTSADLGFATKIQGPGDLKVDLGASVHAIVGLNVVAVGTSFSMVEARVGPKQSLSLQRDVAQARDASYASDYDLKVVLAVSPGEDLANAIKRLEPDASVSLSFEATPEHPLARSPTGTLTADKPLVLVGRPVRLAIDLDPATLSYLMVETNVAELRIARREEDGSLLELTRIPALASGQTHFEWTWTPGSKFAGPNELVAFVTTQMLPGVPLEIRGDSTAHVEVVEACVADAPVPTTPPSSAAPRPRSSAPPTTTPPPMDPCQADGQVSTRIEWDTDTPQPSSGWWQAGGSVTFEVDPDASFDGMRVFELTRASLIVSGEFRAVNTATDVACVTSVPEQRVNYDNPLGPDHYGHPDGGGQVSLDTVGVEGLPEYPAGNYYGQISLIASVTGTVTCTGPGNWPAEWTNEFQAVVPLIIRSPITDPGAPTFVIAEDGRMSGSDSWDDPFLPMGGPGRITSSWNFVPSGD